MIDAPNSSPEEPRRRIRRLREEVGRYKRLFAVSATLLALVSVAFLVFALTDEPETINLGTVRVGIDTLAADTAVVAAEEARHETTGDVAEELPEGEASYYGDELAGRPTASGETFDPGRLTAAHRTLPMGTRLRVTNVRNGESVVVRVNDRGPFSGNRVLDLSYAAAREIGMIRSGASRVRMEILK